MHGRSPTPCIRSVTACAGGGGAVSRERRQWYWSRQQGGWWWWGWWQGTTRARWVGCAGAAGRQQQRRVKSAPACRELSRFFCFACRWLLYSLCGQLSLSRVISNIRMHSRQHFFSRTALRRLGLVQAQAKATVHSRARTCMFGCHCAAARGAARPMQPRCLSNAAAPSPSVCVCVFPALLVPALQRTGRILRVHLRSWCSAIRFSIREAEERMRGEILCSQCLNWCSCIEVPPRECLHTTTSIVSICACSNRRYGRHRASCLLVCQLNAYVGAVLHSQLVYGTRLNLRHVWGQEISNRRLGRHPTVVSHCAMPPLDYGIRKKLFCDRLLAAHVGD